MDTRKHRGSRGMLVACAAIALNWRIAAFLSPSAFIDVDDAFRLPTALLGLLFLGCGLYAALRARNETARVFLLYCFGSAIHWGGSIAAPGNAEIVLLSVYITLSTLADGALLHLALIFPRPLVSSAAAKAPPYIPTAMGILLIPASVVASTTTFQTWAGTTLMLASLLSIGAGVILIGQYIRQPAPRRRRLRLDIVVFCGLTSTALALAGSGGLISGQPDAWNLLFGVFPITLALALTLSAKGQLEKEQHELGRSQVGEWQKKR